MFGKIINTVGSRMIIAVFNFFLLIATTQLLGIEGAGEVSIFLLDVTLVVNFNNFVGGPSLIYLVPRYPTTRLLIPSYLWCILSAGAVTAVLYFSHLVKPEIAMHVFGLGLLHSIGAIHLMILLGKDRIKAHNLTSVLMVVGNLAGLLVFAVLLNDRSIWAYINALYLSQLATALLGFALLIRELGPISLSGLKEELKVLAKFGFFGQLASFAQLLNFRLGFYILERWVENGIYQVGIYSTGVKIAEALWLVSRSISLVQYAAISNLENRQEAQNLTVTLLKFNTIATLILLVPVLLIPEDFYGYLFGDKDFSNVRLVVLYLCPGIIAFAAAGSLSHYFSGIGKYTINSIASGLGLGITIVLGLVLIPTYGWPGAAVTAIASYFTTGTYLLIIFMKDSKKNIGTFIPVKEDFQSLFSLIQNKITQGKKK